MILRFRFANFHSFEDPQALSLIASSLHGLPDAAVDQPGLKEKVLTACAIYGSNASGKTSVLRAIQFMDAAIRESHRSWGPQSGVPIEPFKASNPSVPSEFVIDFIHGGTRHQYGFSADRERILREWLYTYPSGRRQVWFNRTGPSTISFGRNLPGDNKTISGLMRTNSLFLSAAAQNNHDVLTPVHQWFYRSLNFVFGDRHPIGSRTMKMCAEETNRNLFSQLLSVADLGIANVQYKVRDVEPPMMEKRRKAVEALAKIFELKTPDIEEFREVSAISLVHRLGDELVPFELDEESDGTLAYMSLLGPIIRALHDGTILAVDELDSSLHPLVAAYIVRLFNDRQHNPNGAQLIYNTHNTTLLSHNLLRRDQIWFTEKDHVGKSHLYPLTDFKPRAEERLETGYLQGRYGAIPFINSELVLEKPSDHAEA